MSESKTTVRCVAPECTHSATLGYGTCTAHRLLESALLYEEVRPSRTALFYALVLAGAVMLVAAAWQVVELAAAGRGP